MKCRIDAPHLKSWSKILSTMTCVGDEDIHFAVTDGNLTLTVFNASLSVSSTVTFFKNFFNAFIVPRGFVRTFKLPAKCIVRPFRSMRFITKSCTFCEIEFEDNKDFVLVTMGVKSLAEIRYTIQMLENDDELQADYDTGRLGNWIRTEAKLMLSNLSHFGHGKGITDLTLKTQGHKILMKNCATDLMRKEGKIYTELVLSTLAFDRFTIADDVEVTFQMKDFKVFLSLGELLKLPVTVYFHGAQDPVIATIKGEELEATLMLATKYIDEDEAALATSQTSSDSNAISNVSSSEGRAAAATTNKKKKKKEPVPVSVPAPAANSASGSILRNEQSRQSTRDVASPIMPFPHDLDGNENVIDPPPFMPPSSPSVAYVEEVVPPLVNRSSSSSSSRSHSSSTEGNKTTSRKRNNSKRGTKKKEVEVVNDENQFEGEGPPRKRMRDLFRMLERPPRSIYERFPGHDIILVGPSDDEEEPNSAEESDNSP